jgi:Domain of unknown function (DUF4157)
VATLSYNLPVSAISLNGDREQDCKLHDLVMSASASASLTTRESKTGKTRSSCSEGQKTNLSPRILSPVDQISFLQRTIGNREVGRFLNSRVSKAESIGNGQSVGRSISPPSATGRVEHRGERMGNSGPSVLPVPLVARDLAMGAVQLRAGRVLQRKCACGGAADMSGECEECRNKRRLDLQTKLKVNEPGDVYEQEADRVADQVMATPARHSVSGAPPHIRRFSGQSNELPAVLPSVDQALTSPGKPLESRLRQGMEERFGCNFSRVQVHTGATASQSTRDLNAHAYTVGNDIMFGAGRFSPETDQGRRLLAHELTHVVQQSCAVRIHGDRSNQTRHPSLAANCSIARKPAGAIEGPSSAVKMMTRDEARGSTSVSLGLIRTSAGRCWRSCGSGQSRGV